MLKFHIGFERRAGMTRTECHDHLRGVHAPLVAGVPEFTRYVLRYVQNYAISGPHEPASGFVPDGAAQLSFASAEDFVAAYSEPKYLADVRPDEANFTNTARYVATFTREEVLLEGAGSVKLIRFLKGGPGPYGDVARSAWRAGLSDVLAANREAGALVTRIVQNWSIPASDNPFPLAEQFEGVDELWFRDTPDALRYLSMERTLLAPVAELMDLSASVQLLVREGVMPGYGG
jgi:EthD domain